MGFVGKFLAGTIRGTLGTAVAVVKDTVTLGGVLTDEVESYSGKNYRKTAEDIEESLDDLADGDFL